MKLSSLSSLLQGELIGRDGSYTSVSIDSRSLKAGALFVAIAGERFDGHEFVRHAQEQGAIAALVEREVSCETPLVRVADTRQALGRLAQAHRQAFSIPVIALTGSCGKTTSKEMLRSILGQCGSVLASHKSFNNELGVPLTLLELNPQHHFAVIELGANHPGEIHYLSQIAQPTVGLITNIAPAHLQGFGSIEGVAKAKSEIFSGLTPEGVAVINSDDPFSMTWASQIGSHPVVRFGLGEAADFRAQASQMDQEGRAQFVLKTPHGAVSIHLALPGKHNVLNALAAAAAASQVGASLSDIKSGLEKMQEVPGRIVVLSTQQGATIIDDTYNANPASMAAALQLLSHYPGRRIFVMGDMGELGEQSPRYHQEIGRLAKTLQVENLYACGSLTVFATQAFGEGAQHYPNQDTLVQALKPFLERGVTILIKGSRRAQMEKVLHALIDLAS